MAEHDEEWLAAVVDPEGRRVVLLAPIWTEKVVRDHPELAEYLDEVVSAVEARDHGEADVREGDGGAIGGGWSQSLAAGGRKL